MRRRQRHYPLAPSPLPRWLKVYDLQRNELARRQLPAWHDLAAELQQEADRWHADGWTIEGDGGANPFGMFFMHRAGARLFVTITPAEEPEHGHSTP